MVVVEDFAERGGCEQLANAIRGGGEDQVRNGCQYFGSGVVVTRKRRCNHCYSTEKLSASVAAIAAAALYAHERIL